jgi:hypothetical protein
MVLEPWMRSTGPRSGIGKSLADAVSGSQLHIINRNNTRSVMPAP